MKLGAWQRFWPLIITALLWSMAMYGLGALWYGRQEWLAWRWFNDLHEWLLLDKLGHALGAYQLARLCDALLRRANISRWRAALLGALAGFFMLSAIELFDGYAAGYGASAWDLVANAAGALLLVLNHALFGRQRISLRFSFWPSGMALLRPELLGRHLGEQWLKDYNGMSFWLSANPKQLFPRLFAWWPAWLNLALGYGGQGMLGGYGKVPEAEIAAREYTQWYVGLDIDWEGLPNLPPWLRTCGWAVNALRLPLPALRLDRLGWALGLGF